MEDPARIVFVRHLMESSKKREQVKNESEVSFPLVFVVEHETDLNLSCLSSYYTSLDSYPNQVRNTARNLFVREPELIPKIFPHRLSTLRSRPPSLLPLPSSDSPTICFSFQAYFSRHSYRSNSIRRTRYVLSLRHVNPQTATFQTSSTSNRH